MRVIFGLGNPGKKYEKTRHNVGFMVLDEIVKKNSPSIASWEKNKKLGAVIWKNDDLLLVKPQTFMNESGISVKAVMNLYKLEPEHILVIHDDSDQKVGSMKISERGRSGGHKGIESIINALGVQEFKRIKIGIRPEHNTGKSELFVLKPFGTAEKKIMAEKISAAADAATNIWEKGAAWAMNTYNT